MRLRPEEATYIRELAQQVCGAGTPIRLFGSRLRDDLSGGDVDLFLDLPQPPENVALLAATLSGQISRRMHGRKVDVVIAAPGLMPLPIHDVARAEGVVL